MADGWVTRRHPWSHICVHGSGGCDRICRLLLPRLSQADDGGRKAFYRFPVRLKLEPNSLGLYAFGGTVAPVEPIRSGHHKDDGRDNQIPSSAWPIGVGTQKWLFDFSSPLPPSRLIHSNARAVVQGPK